MDPDQEFCGPPMPSRSTLCLFCAQLPSLFVGHRDPACRRAFVAILAAAWGPAPEPLRDGLLRAPLMAAAGDADPEVRGEALAFWRALLPATPLQRLQVCAESIYDGD